VVRDNILAKLHRRALVSLSLTSRSLQHSTRKYLYRELITYQKHRDLVESNLRRDPTLIPYILSFTSYDPTFLQWMWLQLTILSLRELELQWDILLENDGYPKFIESIPPRTPVERLMFRLKSALEESMLSCLHAFSGQMTLKLRNEPNSEYTLQIILE
jgi:hypothetical protein